MLVNTSIFDYYMDRFQNFLTAATEEVAKIFRAVRFDFYAKDGKSTSGLRFEPRNLKGRHGKLDRSHGKVVKDMSKYQEVLD
jgi:hypothetical protein